MGNKYLTSVFVLLAVASATFAFRVLHLEQTLEAFEQGAGSNSNSVNDTQVSGGIIQWCGRKCHWGLGVGALGCAIFIGSLVYKCCFPRALCAPPDTDPQATQGGCTINAVINCGNQSIQRAEDGDV